MPSPLRIRLTPEEDKTLQELSLADTVIIQDGASFHRSKKVQQYWQRWQQQGLYIFFLPTYSPQMNRIEDEWLHLKRDELCSQIFEDEYELALALIHPIQNRADKSNYSVERFIFNHV